MPLRITSLNGLKTYLTREIDRLDQACETRLESAATEQDAKHYVDAATHLSVAAKKKAVRDFLKKIANALTASQSAPEEHEEPEEENEEEMDEEF